MEFQVCKKRENLEYQGNYRGAWRYKLGISRRDTYGSIFKIVRNFNVVITHHIPYLRVYKKLFVVENIHFLNDLIKYLADATGSIVSAKRISDYLKSQQIKLNPKLVLEYLVYLESVYFVDRVKRSQIGGKKIFEIGDKFFFEDLGMRHALTPYQQNDINKVLENMVYHHLKAWGYSVFVGKYDVKEIDFVAEKSGNKLYIQVAYIISDEETHDREFGNLLSIDDNFPKMVISMDETASGNFKGIEHLHIRKFLLEFH